MRRSLLFCFLSIEPHKYQLWAYIYQARDLLAMDESGMNGMTSVRPVSYAVVSRPCTQKPSTPFETQISILASDSTLTFSAVSLRFVPTKKIHLLSAALRKKENKQLKKGQTTNYWALEMGLHWCKRRDLKQKKKIEAHQINCCVCFCRKNLMQRLHRREWVLSREC